MDVKSQFLAAVEREDWGRVRLLYERLSGRSTARGRFPYEEGDTVYLRCPEWHYIGLIVEVDIGARWVALFPCMFILETVDPEFFFRHGMGGHPKDRFKVSPVEIRVGLECGWSACLYPHDVPVVSYKVPEHKRKKRGSDE